MALVLFPSRFVVVLCFGFALQYHHLGYLENPMKVIKDSLLYHRDGGFYFFDMANQLENSTIAEILLFLVSWMPVTSCFLPVWKKLEPESNSIVVCQSLCLSKVAIISNVILEAVNSIFEAHLG